eukprot:10281942-Alexandrium_andersonii.AAC.1
MPYSIPVMLFGDDATVFKGRSMKMLVLQLCFVLSRSSSVYSKVLLTVLPFDMVVKGQTLNDLHRAVQWAFSWALAGKYATTDHMNQPITEAHGKNRYQNRNMALVPWAPYRLVFVGAKGDAKYEKETYGFRSYDNTRCCKDCLASKTNTDVIYTETGASA